MSTIDVYQSEFNNTIPLEYIGKVKYIGETFGVDGLTNNNIYNVVFDKDNNIKIVDDSGEDYLYDLNNPKPLDDNSKGGRFYIIDDVKGILSKIIK